MATAGGATGAAGIGRIGLVSIRRGDFDVALVGRSIGCWRSRPPRARDAGVGSDARRLMGANAAPLQGWSERFPLWYHQYAVVVAWRLRDHQELEVLIRLVENLVRRAGRDLQTLMRAQHFAPSVD